MSQLDDFRASKDEAFRGHHSPLAEEQQAKFAGLVYYDEDPDFAYILDPEPFPEQETLEMQTSTGDTASYLRWARISFEVGSEKAQLTVFKSPDSSEIFLPFQDANAGGETYGAGRYLEALEHPSGKLLVDFNYAYNPNCAYNESWSCPIPPFENRLSVAITAGEKTFPGEAA